MFLFIMLLSIFVRYFFVTMKNLKIIVRIKVVNNKLLYFQKWLVTFLSETDGD